MLTVLGVLMGIDLSAMERPEGSNEVPPGVPDPSPASASTPSASSSKPQPPATPTSAPDPVPTEDRPKAPAPPVDDDAMEVDDDSEAKAKVEAEDLKAKGNTAYKARKFDEAIGLYEKAWEVYPKDVTFLTNLSAVFFEKGDYEKCIETCEKAVEEGRDLRSDYKVIAKAFGRMGSAYSKLNDLENAIKYYSKSLTEHRTPDILTKLRDAEKAKAEADRQAYIDPEKAEAAREEGNAAFKAGDFASAVKHYSEAIKRLPTDPRGYNNRAAAYHKLLAMPEAIKDADAAIKIDPHFIKAYIRKALTQQATKELSVALETLQKATEMDTEKKHTREIETNMSKIMMELQAQRSTESDEDTYQRAMRDPEVAEIMADPFMRQILSDSQQDPRALRDHMKNPMIAQKIQKLINAGIIKTR
ncbi:TPR-like protein [Naematelia encephala]|uniref:TPR-like protein n=1 Tax=Naematelia encephala TaxID=71784 RepID=A0A1Y2BCQ9_9TREE|nr:TPR-like protein [Naematelia encephala]